MKDWWIQKFIHMSWIKRFLWSYMFSHNKSVIWYFQRVLVCRQWNEWNWISFEIGLNENRLQATVYWRLFKSRLFRIGVHINFAILTGKHLCYGLFLIKFKGRRPAILLKRDSNTGVVLVKFFRTAFL